MNGLQKLLLGTILIEIPFQLDKYYDYQLRAADFGAIGGWNISLTTILLFFLYLTWIPGFALQKQLPSREAMKGAGPALFYVFMVGLSAIFAYSMKLSGFELFLLLQALALMLFVMNWVRTERDITFVVTFLMLGLLGESLLMLYVREVGHEFKIFEITARVHENGRVAGSIGSPNSAASYLALMMCLAVGVLVSNSSWKLRGLAAVAFGFGSIALVTTLSRGGWVACGLGVSIICAAAVWRGRMSIVAPGFMGAIALMIAIFFAGSIKDRFTNDDKGSAESRIPLMLMALDIVGDHPIIGVGANNMAVAMQPYANSAGFRGGFVFVVHNRYLQVWAETGFVGLCAFLAFFSTIALRAWKSWSHNDAIISPIALGVCAGVAAELLHMLVDVFGGRALTLMIFLLAGLVVAMLRIQKETAEEAQSLSRGVVTHAG